MKHSLVSMVLLVAGLHAAVARAEPTAAALFQQGLEDMEAGKTAEACEKLAASVATTPESGAVGALADCYTALGRFADAWELWRGLSTSAPSPWVRDYATKAAAALDTRIARVAVRIRGDAPANLVVTLDGKPVSAVDAAEHPVAPGMVTVVAVSPEIEQWTRTFYARPGATTTIELPVDASRNERRRQKRVERISLALVGAGAAAVAVGVVYGGRAYLDWHSASTDCGGTTDHCNTTGYDSAQRQLASARRSATVSSWSTGIGLGAVAAGLITYLAFREPSRSESRTAWQASPMMGPQVVGVVLSRSVP